MSGPASINIVVFLLCIRTAHLCLLFLGLDEFFANLGGGGGYAWIIGASLGALIHLAISSKR